MSPAPERCSHIARCARAASLGVSILCCVSAAIAQSNPADVAVAAASNDELLEAYLADRGLVEPLAAHLRVRLNTGSRDDQLRAAEALGKLYVRMLSETSVPEVRQRLEAQSRELLERVPEADSFDLRIDLAKATYLPVEEVVEQDRLRLASDSARSEAQRVLSLVTPQFEEIASKLQRKVDALEKREAGAREADLDHIRSELSEMRRLRSLSRYYSGWAAYYSAVLARNPRIAQRAMEDFGYLLNAVPGKPATLERLPKGLLKYEHVARAAIACGLCSSMLGNDVEAVRWLDEVEQAEGVPDTVLAQMFSRRLLVYAAASRWADVDVAVRRQRRSTGIGMGDTPLEIGQARLLAVLALEASRDPQIRPGTRALAEKMAQVGLGDLVTAGAVSHVLDLVRLYGTAPMAREGFVVTYVRGLQAFDRARESHLAGGGPAASELAPTPALVNAYREAADLLASARSSADASQFPAERAKAGIREGLARLYAGDFAAAAEALEQAATGAPTKERADALGFAIAALDRAVAGPKPSLAAHRDELATLYLKEFPQSEYAVKLLLRQTRADRLNDDKALEILLGIPQDSPVYPAARRQAARMLYEAYRQAPENLRDSAALRFADIAEPLLRAEHARAMGERDAAGMEAAKGVALRARQLAEVILGMSAPDVPRARAALEALESAANYQGLDTRDLAPELSLRRMQAALATGDQSGVERELSSLRRTGGVFADFAERILYRNSLKLWKASSGDPNAAMGVVRHGQRVLETSLAAGVKPGDPSMVALRDAVAEAAVQMYGATHDPVMRDLAAKIDQEQLGLGFRTAPSLRRLAAIAESRNEPAAALDFWTEVASGTSPPADAWFEARYNSIRLLAKVNPVEALAAMKQHRVLYPTLGPSPWKERFDELEKSLVIGAPVGGGP